MNSSPHRSLILSSYFPDFGVGYARDPSSQYGHYWTVNFGRRATTLSSQSTIEPVLCTFTLDGPAGGSSLAVGYIQAESTANQLRPLFSLGSAAVCR
jgi:hypothetical protein